MTTPGTILRAVVEGLAKKIKDSMRRDVVPVTFTLIKSEDCVTVDVPRRHLHTFLQKVGTDAIGANLVDPQFWIQARSSKRNGDHSALHGVVIDVDEKHEDLIGLLEALCLPLPSFYFDTPRGHRLAYVFDAPVDERTFRAFATYIVLSIPGADIACVAPTEAQRLSTCLRSRESEIEKITNPPHLINAQPFMISGWEPRLPSAVTARLRGASVLSADARKIIEKHLTSLGLKPPTASGRVRYNRCLAKRAHSKDCCYVNRRRDGTIWVHCLAGHGGTGPRGWSEGELYRLATGQTAEDDTIDVERDVPVTWAGRALMEHLLMPALECVDASELRIRNAIDLWALGRGHQEAKWLLERNEVDAMHLPKALAVTLDLYRRRFDGIDSAGPTRLLYEDELPGLGLFDVTNRVVPASGGATFGSKQHKHEWWATTAVVPTVEHIDGEDDAPPIIEIVAKERDADSDFDKARQGYRPLLKKLGVPVVKVIPLPLAFQRSAWGLDKVHRVVTATVVADLARGKEDMDVVGFLDELRLSRHLPFASRDDVKRFVMLLASPFLREVAPGLLGLYWFLGKPGAGKEYCATIADRVWRAASLVRLPVTAELSDTDDLELKRAAFAARNALFVRAKEAGKTDSGKRGGLVEKLIRLSATEFLSARGMRKDEMQIRNTLTWLADSAEDIEDRREIHRRTVVINLVQEPDEESRGEALRRIEDRAIDILASLRAKIETRDERWYREQRATDTRPVVHVALARLFEVQLPTVKGGSMHELWETLLDYVTHYGAAEAKRQRARARPADGKAVVEFDSYRVAHFIEEMKKHTGYGSIMAAFAKPPEFISAIRRETSYDGGRGHHSVRICGKWYVFRYVYGKRAFILEPEIAFCNKMGIAVPDRTEPERTEPDEADTAPAPGPANSPPDRALDNESAVVRVEDVLRSAS